MSYTEPPTDPVGQPPKQKREDWIKKNPKKANALGCGVLLLVIFAIASSCGLMLGGDEEQETDGPDRVTNSDAQTACREFIKRGDSLKSPDSAKFPDEADVYRGEGGEKGDPNEFTVMGMVDAENAMGVSLRNHYTCQVRYEPDEEQWRLLDVKIERN